MKKLFLLALLLLSDICMSARDPLWIDGLRYNLDAKNRTAEVVSGIQGKDSLYADYTVVDIPQTVVYRRRSYRVTGIGKHAFEWCKNLDTVRIPDGVTDIDDCAFNGCMNLHHVSLPNSVRRIGGHAFYACYCLSSVILPGGLTEIWQYAFGFCSFDSVNIPASVIGIDEGIFDRCANLTAIHVAADNPEFCSIDGVLFTKDTSLLICYPMNKPNIIYTIPQGVKAMPGSYFGGGTFMASNLRSVIIPEGVREIPWNTFSNSQNLRMIVIPASVEEIGSRAFYDCPALKIIVCHALRPPKCARNAFCEYTVLPHVFVPEESVEWYQSNPNWGNRFLFAPQAYYTADVLDVISDSVPNEDMLVCREGKKHSFFEELETDINNHIPQK